MTRRGRLYFTNLILGAGVILGGTAFFFFHGREKPGPPPNIDPLRQILEKSATERLGSPQLSTGSITVDTTREKMASELDWVTGAARQLQGTAIRGDDEAGNAKLLVRLPAGNAAKFSELVTGHPAARPESAGDSTVFIDVVFRAGPAAAGEPSP